MRVGSREPSHRLGPSEPGGDSSGETRWERFLAERLRERYQGGPVIDIGCGRGRWTHYVGALGIPVLGVDVDPNEIELARHNASSDLVEYQHADLSSLQEGHYSGALLIDVLEHVDDPRAFLAQTRRLCRDGAFLILTVPNGYCLREVLIGGVTALRSRFGWATGVTQVYRRATGKPCEYNDSPHIQHFTMSRLVALIRESGFVVEDHLFHGVWSNLRWTFLYFSPPRPGSLAAEQKLEQMLPPHLLERWCFLCRAA